MGVVGRPSAVTGLAAISIMAETTFMPGYHPSWKLSHTAGASGLAWRLISNCTVLVAMVLSNLFCLTSRVQYSLFLAWSRYASSMRGKPAKLQETESRANRIHELRIWKLPNTRSNPGLAKRREEDQNRVPRSKPFLPSNYLPLLIRLRRNGAGAA